MSVLKNENVTWETSEQIDLGVTLLVGPQVSIMASIRLLVPIWLV